MAMLKTGLKRRLELDVIRDHAAEEKERTARLTQREERKAAEARPSREALFRKEEAAYVARRVQAHMVRSLAQIRSQVRASTNRRRRVQSSHYGPRRAWTSRAREQKGGGELEKRHFPSAVFAPSRALKQGTWAQGMFDRGP